MNHTNNEKNMPINIDDIHQLKLNESRLAAALKKTNEQLEYAFCFPSNNFSSCLCV